MKTLIMKNRDVPEERREMLALQSEVMDEITKWVQKKIPNFVSICSGDEYQIAILVGNPEKTTMELRYEIPFVREDFLTPNAEKCHDFLYKWVNSAFRTNAHWQIKTFEKLEDEKFLVVEES